jgi:hypothetical protein
MGHPLTLVGSMAMWRPRRRASAPDRRRRAKTLTKGAGAQIQPGGAVKSDGCSAYRAPDRVHMRRVCSSSAGR